MRKVAPRRFGAWKCSALCAERIGDSAVALEACLHALEIQPDDPEMREMRDRLAPVSEAGVG